MQAPWALREDALESLIEMCRLALSGNLTISSQFDDEIPQESPGEDARKGSVGVVPIRGLIKQHPSSGFFDFFFGGASTELVGRQIEAFIKDSSVNAIVLDIDSPGGSGYGVTELANKIMSFRGQKPILAVANSMAASAAYWIGAAADYFYASPSALVGSVGVYILHMDISKLTENEGVKPTFISAGKNKTRGNQFEPLSDEDISFMQRLVDDSYNMFIADVARGRRVDDSIVRKNYGEGDVLTPKQAKRVGMIDGIKTIDEVIAEAVVAKKRPLRANSTTAEADIEIEATDPIDYDQRKQEFARLRLQLFQNQQAALASAKGE